MAAHPSEYISVHWARFSWKGSIPSLVCPKKITQSSKPRSLVPAGPLYLSLILKLFSGTMAKRIEANDLMKVIMPSITWCWAEASCQLRAVKSASIGGQRSNSCGLWAFVLVASQAWLWRGLSEDSQPIYKQFQEHEAQRHMKGPPSSLLHTLQNEFFILDFFLMENFQLFLIVVSLGVSTL